MDKKYLTPEEVQEFINLGVDFGETADVWLCERNSTFFGRIQRKDEYPIQQMETEEVYHLPAPTLLEMLEVLPKQLIRNGEICRLCLIYNYNSQVWHAGYKCRVESWYGDFCPYNSNPLIVVANLLRWLCNNHPETLTKSE